MDRIELTGLRARGFHGALKAERELGQEFIVDVALGLDLRPAGENDDLTRTVHYGDLATALVAIVEGPAVDLIETLAERLAVACLGHTLVQEATVTVHKPAAPIPHPFTDVAVTITRSRT